MPKHPLSELQAALALVEWKINQENVAALHDEHFVEVYVDHASENVLSKVPAESLGAALSVLGAYGVQSAKHMTSAWLSVASDEMRELFDLER
jgi:hypothetical protein